MKKIMIWLKWFLYVMLTQDERLMYDYGKAKGRNCVGIKKGMTYTDFYSTPGKTERNFMTRKEFFNHLEQSKQ